MASYKTTAIIINRLNLGESDRILTLFSLEFGKIKAICKGARKTKSKFGGYTELFSRSEFLISTGKSLDIVNEVSLLDNYLAASPDMEKIKTAYYLAEIINKLLPEHAPNEDIYHVFVYCLEKINSIDTGFLQLIFVAKTLKTLGIYPELSQCIKCEQKPDRSHIYFTGTGGGITDEACAIHFEDAYPVGESVIKLWRHIADTPVGELDKIRVGNDAITSANALANSYIHCVTMIDYKSLRVLS